MVVVPFTGYPLWWDEVRTIAVRSRPRGDVRHRFAVVVLTSGAVVRLTVSNERDPEFDAKVAELTSRRPAQLDRD